MSSQATLQSVRPAPRYVEDVVRASVLLATFWGVAAFLVGVVIAAQLVWPQLSLDTEFLTFGRLRPLHTSAAIFAYAGNNGVASMSMGVGLTVVLALFIDAGTVTADFNRWAPSPRASLFATFSALMAAFPMPPTVASAPVVGSMTGAPLVMPYLLRIVRSNSVA